MIIFETILTGSMAFVAIDGECDLQDAKRMLTESTLSAARFVDEYKGVIACSYNPCSCRSEYKSELFNRERGR